MSVTVSFGPDGRLVENQGPPLLIPQPIRPLPAYTNPILWEDIQSKWQANKPLDPAEELYVEAYYNSPEFIAKRDARENRKECIGKYATITIVLLVLGFIGYLFIKEGIIPWRL